MSAEERKEEQLNTDHRQFPSSSAIAKALDDENYRREFFQAVRSICYTLIMVVAFALLIATLIFPVLQIYGNAMEPTVKEDSFVLAVKSDLPHRGDVLAFYYNNKILVRRVIGLPGDTVTVDKSGTVIVNGEVVQETYIDTHALGNSDREYPFEVPGGQYFVMADNREEATDSRNSIFGCIVEEDFIGRVFFNIWPLEDFGFIR